MEIFSNMEFQLTKNEENAENHNYNLHVFNVISFENCSRSIDELELSIGFYTF